DERVGLLVGQHATDLLAQDRRRMQRAVRGELQQLVVGNRAPQKEREARRELEVADAVHRSRREAGWIVFDAERELRAREEPLQSRLNPGFEASLLAPHFVELVQSREVAVRHVAAIGATRERRDDAPGTGIFV